MALRNVIVAISLVVYVSSLHLCVTGVPKVPCFYIFGDSLSDCGTNNLLPTMAKVLYPPYGCDLSLGPSGRFTNGRTIVDIFSEELGFDFLIPTFTAKLATVNNETLQGLNYASGASGIRDETGNNVGYHVSLGMQLGSHNGTVERVGQILGSPEAAKNHLSKCIYSVGIGSNDYLNNYYLPLFFKTSKMFNPEQYAEALVNEYTNQMERLYGYGARKIVIIGLANIGCIPVYRKKMPNGECDEKINSAVQLFNRRIVAMVDNFNQKLPDARFIYINITGMSTPEELKEDGLLNTKDPCCPVGISGLCLPLSTPCEHRDKYFYWDSYHPTDAVNVIAGKAAYSTTKKNYVYPYDISHLVQEQI